MNASARERVAYISLAVATIALGLLVHLRGASRHPDLRDVLGDALWAAMILWCVSAVAPRASRVERGTVEPIQQYDQLALALRAGEGISHEGSIDVHHRARDAFSRCFNLLERPLHCGR